MQKVTEFGKELRLGRRFRRLDSHRRQLLIPLLILLLHPLHLPLPIRAHDREKRRLNIRPQLRTRLDKPAAQLLRQLLALHGPDEAPSVEIALVADEDDQARREAARVELALDVDDLVEERFGRLEGAAPRHVVHDDEELVLPYPLLAQRPVFFLPGRVEDLEVRRDPVDYALPAVAVFEGWVVGLGEVVHCELWEEDEGMG